MLLIDRVSNVYITLCKKKKGKYNLMNSELRVV